MTDEERAKQASKNAKIVAARLKLKARFEAQITSGALLSDASPQGSGAPNRHGMPTVPVGQYVTQKWPVLDLGLKPAVSAESWTLTVDGLAENHLKLDWQDFMALPQVDDVSDFHCVTTWSRLDMRWRGVRLSTILALARPTADATHLMAYGADRYTTNISLGEGLKDDVLLVHTVEGEPLPGVHGGPVRMITPQLYAWKGAKWILRLELMCGDRPGFWEQRGYSMSAHPWRNDRYSAS